MRWKGLLRACGSGTGSTSPTTVMASLLVCPHKSTLKRPSRNAIMFMGDCVRGIQDPVVDKLSRLENVVELLVSKLGEDVNAWVLQASRFQGSFACYEAFLPSLSACGEPFCYQPDNFPAARGVIAVLNDCLHQVNDRLQKAGLEPCFHETKEVAIDTSQRTASRSFPRTVLLGFSKGGVILNQLLSEISHFEGALNWHDVDSKQGQLATSSQVGAVGQITSTKPVAVAYEQEAFSHAYCIWPATVNEFFRSITEIHYIDVGLNCQGAYQTNMVVLENVLKAAVASGSGLHLGFHGTPRQWSDKARPWIAWEKDQCIKTLQMLARRLENDALRTSEKLYFKDDRPSLRMHFEILEALNLD